ncbi:hypothetical protein [Deinococcus hopiensis]|uniref:Uncharacterized protein n=1 Tax=Deinococcus hopiensis KR-140 TaxID=695939 RepID=A0A1W1VP08_9DEIO|nr:hypothetical protein [Deinococcus hopiensis]SMB95087.1 hypothetical protein SAMN00790413_02682 [Deinococcus hopiensis KR-140]
MPGNEPPFLNVPLPGGAAPGGEVPAALFDLAVNRAAAALRGLRPSDPGPALAAWHARTRFARRVPLGAVARALRQHPTASGEWHWAGGLGGGWVPGKAPFP